MARKQKQNVFTSIHSSKTFTRRLACGFLLLALFSVRAFADTWEPRKTYVLLVGVLSWEKNSLPSFPARHRKDRELYQTLIDRGVPRQNIVLLLDKQATHHRICNSLQYLAQRAGPDSTLIFYYAGHGEKTSDGEVAFCNYDYKTQKGLRVSEISGVLQREFKGGRVLFLADCCHSGGLKEAVQILARNGCKAASLTSADAANISTRNWTFTQTVLDGLRGDPLADANADGAITLGEMAAEVSDAMKYREEQKAGFFNAGFGIDCKLAPAKRQRSAATITASGWSLHDYVKYSGREGERIGRITGFHERNCVVAFYDYSDRTFARLPGSRLSRIQFDVYPAGRQVQVLWKGRPYAAEILEVAGDFHWITYPGWPAHWNEWVLSNRIVGK